MGTILSQKQEQAKQTCMWC